MTYSELHCKTNYSFLTGASHADELVDRAIELGYQALAITDENTLAGIVRAYAAVREANRADSDARENRKASTDVVADPTDIIPANDNLALPNGD